MKIASLLPSATEIVYALGLEDALVGVTDGCDFPAGAGTKPVVSRSALPQDGRLDAGGIDAAVRERMQARQPLYALDTDLLRREQPDVILTQDLCRVCAVPAGHVHEALDRLGVAVDTKVLSLDPHSLEDVIAQLEIVGSLLGAGSRGRDLATGLRDRVEAVTRTAARLPPVDVFCLEWADPPFVAGHWIPQMASMAGGTNLLNTPGEPSRTVTHREIRDAGPELLVFMPCGYGLEEAEDEGAGVIVHPELAATPAVRQGNAFAVDATAYFSRPGPRLVDGLEILAWATHPEAFPEPPPGTIARLA